MRVCTSLQTDNHASTSPLSFLQAGCPSCRPTNSVKALKAKPSVFNYSLGHRLMHSMRSRVHVTVGCPSFDRVSFPSPTAAAAVCGGFAAERRAGTRYRSTAAGGRRRPAATAPQHGAQQQKRGQCHTQRLRPSSVLSCWPDGLELTPGFYPGSNAQHRPF